GTPNGDINLNLNGGIITNAYGGGNAATTKVNNVNLNGSIITNLYGGGNQAGATTSNIDAKSGSVSNLFGGSNQSGVVQTSTISANEISKDISSRLNMDVTYTGNNISEWETVDYLAYETLNVNITNSSDTEVTTWSATIVTSDSRLNTNYSSTNIDSNNGVYIFNQENRYWGTNTIPANGSYSFQFGVVSYVPFEEFKIIAVTITGYNSSGVAFTTTLSGLDITNLYGGNNAGGTTNNNNINLNNMTLTNLYGGGNNANVTQDVNLSLNNVIVRGSIYGGGNNGNVSNTNVTIEKSTISGSIYGGGNNGDVLNDASLILKTTSVSSSVYGGGNQGDINGSTNVEVENAIILESIYSGCNAAIVYGNTDILIAGETKISQSVYGGGNSGSVGDNSLNNSTSTVNIIGGIITGNVYGGCNTSVIYGQTLVNIGSSYTTNEYARGTIKISGTVFGGGEANASGSEIYDFSFISVTNGITIDINGSDYTSETLILEGSVFGSGNASSSSGTSIININDLGTKADPNRCISIQRANNVTISNSVIELVGTTDRTNEYSALKYSLNRIDLLKIKNNTTLLLQQNANLLKELQSLVDINNEEVLSEATIDENHNVTRNINNRIYLLTNKNLNVTTNESATAYGKISGMIFLGMYNSYINGEYSYGIYGLESNDESDAGDVITGGSYILGLHPANYDTTKNGFYTNYITEDYTKVEASYIEPTPDSANYYIWAIGVESINYSFALTASKYSSLGTYQLSLIDFAEGNTTFEVLGFNAEGLSEDIDLVDVNNVPKIGSTYEANTIFGLSMKAETTEWTSNDTTKFLSSSNGIYTGATSYLTDNQAAAPTLTFYLYHAKNIDLNANLGSVTVVLQALIPINEIEYDIKLITITIDLTARTYSDDPAYDASITYGKKYEMPSITDVNITNDSSFTTYFSLYADADNMNDIYGLSNNYYHTLSSDFALPVGTKITMLDLGADANSPKYYYYIVNSTDYAQSLIKLANDNEATYNLSKFVAMDSVTATNKYDDYSQNQLYYHDDIDLVVEEFIFIFDFEDTQMTSNQLNNSILLELRTPEDRTSISVLGIRQESLIYNLYEKTNVVLNADIDYGDNYLYYDINKTILYNINIGYDKTSNLQSIIDTNYESNSMGLNITLIDNSGTEVSSSQLVGTSIKMGTSTYYASSDGVFRIKLSNKVSNLTKSFILSVSKNLPSGNYTMKIELFASDDGLHKDKVDNTANIAFTLVGSNNSIESVMVDNEKIIDGVTGNHLNNNNLITTTINYQSVLTKPNIRVAVYKRDNTTYLSNTYNEIDFKSITSTTLTYPAVYSLTSKSEYEYMVSNNPQSINTFIYRLKTNLASGTYKIEYRLYDSNQLIETDTEYLIVKKSLIS
ncbi:MAG: hypothetical protein PHN42_06210, partial [Bacilli bacterium]|nr:hypothetical protein [Bacilli bacterium]